MIRHAAWIGVTLGAAILILPAWALDSRVLAEGARLLRDREEVAAAALWLGSANAAIAEARDPSTRRDGCLLYVLATLAFQRAGDTEAYASWGRAVQCYAATGTSWEIERSHLAVRIRRADGGLRALTGTEAAGGLVREDTAEDAELVALARLLPLATYEGPAFRPSPSSPADDTPRETPVAPFVGPRPPAPAEEHAAPPTPRPGVLPRGVIP